MSNEDSLFQLRRANPVTDTELTPAEQERANETLAAIVARDDFGAEADIEAESQHSPRFGTSRAASLVFVAAGVAALIFLATALLPGTSQPATAQELLVTAARASTAKAAPSSPSSSDYLRRVDRLGETSITSVFLADASGGVKRDTTVVGPENSRLRAELNNQVQVSAAELDATEDTATFVAKRFGTEPAQTARGALTVLLIPGLGGERQHEAYDLLAGLEGTEVAETKEGTNSGEDSLVTLVREKDGLRFSLIPATGQLVSVRGLVGSDVETTVAAAGIVECVHVTGVGGPESLSLACADNNYMLNELKWSGWNSPQATATGQAWINTCEPSCAEGERKQLPVTVTATEQRTCGYNLDVYTRLRVEYSDETKATEPLARDETFNLSCG